MSYIPDCRSDESYNQRYLNDNDKKFLSGFDWCAEAVVDYFFESLEHLDSDYLLTVLNQELPADMQDEYDMEYSFDRESEHREVKTYADYLRSAMLDHIKDSRDEMITSMIDRMDENEYNEIKERVDKEAYEKGEE